MKKRITIENVLLDQLKREMNLDSKTYFFTEEWDSIMHDFYDIPIEYVGYNKKVSQMKYLKEMVDLLSKEDFDKVKRSESRKKQMKEMAKKLSMYYNLIFTKGNKKIGYGALIVIKKPAKEIERSSGIVLMARFVIEDGKQTLDFEKAKFDDFLIEVKPYIDLLGNLYRETKKA